MLSDSLGASESLTRAAKIADTVTVLDTVPPTIDGLVTLARRLGTSNPVYMCYIQSLELCILSNMRTYAQD